MITDSLPDKEGNKIIDVWLNQTGRKRTKFNVVDRLCYTSTRGIGALEFEPIIETEATKAKRLEIHDLIKLAFMDRETLPTKLTPNKEDRALREILAVSHFEILSCTRIARMINGYYSCNWRTNLC